jgi:hypothetical protein
MTGTVTSPPVVPTAPVVIPATPAPSIPATITPLPQTTPSNGAGSWTYDPHSRTTRLPKVEAPRPVDEDKANLVVPAVYSTPVAKTLDDSGWHAARR